MIVMDTDILTLVDNGTPEGIIVRGRMDADGRPQAVTITTAEEKLRGRLLACHRATDPDDYIQATIKLRKTIADLQDRRILDFDDRAADQFRSLKSQRIRIGTMDLRIAAIVLAHDGLLISRNLKDFRKVPNLRVEDWTR
jgi:tRNA(fMet)-specific endonuclease VapC